MASVKGCENCSCSDDLPSSIDWEGRVNAPVGDHSTTTLLLGNETLNCKGSVNAWRLCLYREAGVEETSEIRNVSFGVWRQTSGNGTIYELLHGKLEVIEPSLDFSTADLFCLRHRAREPMNIMPMDRVGVVYSGRSLFSVLAAGNDENEPCSAVMGGINNCILTNYSFYLTIYQGEWFGAFWYGQARKTLL